MMIGTVAVAADGLSKSYGKRRAIERVSFQVERGQICGCWGSPAPGRNVRSLHAIIVMLPVHYWLRWTTLFQGGGAGLAPGLVVQAATAAVVMAAAYAILARRDPAA